MKLISEINTVAPVVLLWYDKSMARPMREQHTFKVVIERDEDGYFAASVPALPGCHTQAKTLQELTRRVRDAIRLCLAVSEKNSQYQKRIARFAYEPSFVGMEVVSVR